MYDGVACRFMLPFNADNEEAVEEASKKPSLWNGTVNVCAVCGMQIAYRILDCLHIVIDRASRASRILSKQICRVFFFQFAVLIFGLRLPVASGAAVFLNVQDARVVWERFEPKVHQVYTMNYDDISQSSKVIGCCHCELWIYNIFFSAIFA